MYFDFQTYGRLLRLAAAERDPRGRKVVRAAAFGVLPAVAAVNAAGFLLDRVAFPGLARVDVREPVFIVGHARSGTTLMHRLMAMDADRFSFFRFYEMFIPALVLKRLARGVGAIDRRYANGALERRIRQREQRALAATAEEHRTSLFSPEEDDFVLAPSAASGFWIVVAPYMEDLDFYYVDEWTPERRRRLLGQYRECVRRQLYANGPHKTHLSKNPTFSGRVESLIEEFPDARFVVLVRNPLEAIPSLLHLLKEAWAGYGWSEERFRSALDVLARQSIHTYRHPLEVLERHPETPHVVVDYRDLIASPRRSVEEVYARFGYALSPAFAEALRREDERARAHTTSYSYTLEEFGLDAGEIRAELADLFDRFGWDRSDARSTDEVTA